MISNGAGGVRLTHRKSCKMCVDLKLTIGLRSQHSFGFLHSRENLVKCNLA